MNARSYGESVLHLSRERFVPGGFSLLDEQDTAISPRRQLALPAMPKETVAEEAHGIVPTHSLIPPAFPGAAILGFDGGRIAEVAYDDVPNVALTRAFLADPAAYLRHL